MLKAQVSRRGILRAGASVALSSLGALNALGAARRRFAMDNLHISVCDRVRKLNNAGVRSLTVLYPKGSLANLEPVASRFSQKTGVAVRYREAPLDDINSQILLSNLAKDQSFDVALPATFGIPDLAQAQAIRNLDEFADQYEPDEFQKSSLYSIGDYYKGSLYGYQTDGDAYIMFYNKAFLDDPDEQKRFSDAFGRPLDLPTTWAELQDLMTFFHRPSDGRFGGSLFRTAGYLPWEWWIRFHSKGFFPLNEEMDPQINNEAGVQALRELIEASAHLDPKTNTDGLFENWASFAAGKSFCNIGWGGSQKYFNSSKSAIRGRLRFGPTPGGLVDGTLLKTPYFNWGWNYVVSANSPEPEIAYLFTLFACSPVISTVSVGHADGYFDPFRPAHYDDPQIVSTYSKDFLDTHRFSMANAIPDLYLDGQGEYFGALRENLAAALVGDLTAKEALDRTASQWRLITFRLGKQSQLEQWTYLKSQYPDAIKGRLK